METSAKTYERFYQNLGKLFYGFAAVDKVVRDKEFEALQKIVNEIWLPFENTTDQFGSDAGFQIEFQFDVLNETSPDAYDCFSEFEEFYRGNPSLFTDEIKQMIWTTADGIASAFAGKNKSELVMLDQLRVLLEG